MGGREEIVQNAVFRGKRDDNKILKVQILLSRNLVVIAQAPTLASLPEPRWPSFAVLDTRGLESARRVSTFCEAPLYFPQFGCEGS